MTIEAVLAALGAILTAAFGVVLIVREFRRRDRQQSMRELHEMSTELHELRADMVTYRKWAYDLAVKLTDMGIAVPPAPEPTRGV